VVSRGDFLASVRLDNISKMFGEVRALDNVNLYVEDGEFLVLLGPSGCGKTTTLRIIAGLELQTSGHVYIGNRLVDDLEPKDRNVAMVFQSYALYPHLTIYDNIAFGLKARHEPKQEIDRKVRDVARMLEITHLLMRKPAALSGGQRQRVALARAIVRNPDVFLLDEPLSNLDAKLRASTRIELKNLHLRLKSTMIFVTHDQVEAMTLADKIAVFNAGKLLQHDTPMNIFMKPANKFVAGFVGYPPMNMIDGEIAEKDGHAVFLSSGLSIRLQSAPAGKCTLGIRPQDIRVSLNPSDDAIACTVKGLERTGTDNFLYMSSDVGDIVASVETGDYTIGQKVYAKFDISSLHFFDPSTGKALPLQGVYA